MTGAKKKQFSLLRERYLYAILMDMNEFDLFGFLF